MAKQIVCIGDSNTWGYDPRGFGGGRYPAAMRWTARLNSQSGWVIHNLGENGREIPHSAFALRLLEQQLDALAPFDGMSVMLGSNDLLCGASPAAAAARMEDLLDRLGAYGAPLLLIAPPRFCPGTWVTEEGPIDASARLAGLYRTLAQDRAVAFADAGEWGIPLAFDGVHFTEEGHVKFAEQAQAAFAQAFGT